jgi:hypothetical protein
MECKSFQTSGVSHSEVNNLFTELYMHEGAKYLSYIAIFSVVAET